MYERLLCNIFLKHCLKKFDSQNFDVCKNLQLHSHVSFFIKIASLFSYVDHLFYFILFLIIIFTMFKVIVTFILGCVHSTHCACEMCYRYLLFPFSNKLLMLVGVGCSSFPSGILVVLWSLTFCGRYFVTLSSMF